MYGSLALTKQPATSAGSVVGADESSSLRASVIPLQQTLERPRPQPSYSSFLAAACFNFVGVTGFTICIPTSKRYAKSLGGVGSEAGAVVGLYPLLSSASQILLVFLLSPPLDNSGGTGEGIKSAPISLRSIFLSFCLIQICGWLCYATAPATFGMRAVFAARAVCGTAAGPLSSYYVARKYADFPNLRAERMMTVSGTISFGYFVGPALGLVIEGVCNILGLLEEKGYMLLNGNTMPGVAMVLLFLLELALILTFFEEPQLSLNNIHSYHPNDPPSEEVEPVLIRQEQHIENGHQTKELLHICMECLKRYSLIFVIAMNRGCWEVITVFYGSFWNWSLEKIAGYLAILNLITALTSLLRPQRLFKSSKCSLTTTFVMAMASSLFFFVIHLQWIRTGSEEKYCALLYSAGSLMILFSAWLGFGVVFDEIALLAEKASQHRQLVLSLGSVAYMWGRACGSMLAPVFASKTLLRGNLYGTVTTAMNGLALLLVMRGSNPL